MQICHLSCGPQQAALYPDVRLSTPTKAKLYRCQSTGVTIGLNVETRQWSAARDGATTIPSYLIPYRDNCKRSVCSPVKWPILHIVMGDAHGFTVVGILKFPLGCKFDLKRSTSHLAHIEAPKSRTSQRLAALIVAVGVHSPDFGPTLRVERNIM